MSTFHATVLRWANEYLDAMLGAPPMWGSNEAVEMQVLLLLELRALALHPEASEAAPDAVFRLYTAFLRRRFPDRGPAPLCEIESAPFRETLAEFRLLLDRREAASAPPPHPATRSELGGWPRPKRRPPPLAAREPRKEWESPREQPR